MKKGSIFAPLLLIGLGGLFLARNMYPDLPLMEYLARYWPFVLILWGVLRLTEVLYWSATKQPLPARGVSGGEWVLVVMLCFFGASVHAVMGFSSWFPAAVNFGGLDIFGETYQYPVAAEKPASKAPLVVIESFRGNARITGGDTDTVKVTGHQSIRSMEQSTADQASKEAVFEITGDANRVVIRTNQDRARRPGRVSADLEITVPKGASLEAHGRDGDFDVHGVNGTVNIFSDRAGVRLENIGGATRLDLTRSEIVRAINLKGSLDVRGDGSDMDLENIDGVVTINGGYTGNVEYHNLTKPVHYVGPQTEFSAEAVLGEVRAPLGTFNATGLTGPVRLQTRNRDVQMSDLTNSVDIQILDRGDIELRPEKLPLGRMNVRTFSGNITLGMPKEAKFDLTASVARGEVVNEFGDPLKEEDYRRGGALKGSNGGPLVELRTEMGKITVRQAAPGEPPLELKRFGRGPQTSPKVLRPLLKSTVKDIQPIDQ
ncbi:MAG TPA: DUF4097 family beta strand repeat-containing protein [Bryobacteraceae bacterium]